MCAEGDLSGETGMALSSNYGVVLLWVLGFLFASLSHEFGFSDASCCFSQNLYRSDLNFMRGVPCVIPGTLEIEGRKKASELISEVTGDPGRTGDRCQSISTAEVLPKRSACCSLLERARRSA